MGTGFSLPEDKASYTGTKPWFIGAHKDREIQNAYFDSWKNP